LQYESVLIYSLFNPIIFGPFWHFSSFSNDWRCRNAKSASWL